MSDSQTWTEIVFKAIVPVATGSLLTLFGVWLQSRFESNRLKIQLQHDADQREKERQMDLRKEVFLSAAETFGKQAEYINLFGKVDFDFWKEQEILRGSIGVAYKIHLIAGLETVGAYSRANQCWAEAIMELSKKRLKVEAVKADLSNKESLIALLSNYRDEALASMKALINSGNASQEAYQFHKKRFDDLQAEISDEFIKKSQLHLELASLLIDISATGVASQAEFAKRLLAVNLAARREVDLPIDEGRYRELQATIMKEVQQVSDAYIEDMKGWIGKQNKA